MKLENYEVHLPSYSIGNSIYDKIGPVCESYGRTVLILVEKGHWMQPWTKSLQR